MRIAICDDEKEVCNDLEKVLFKIDPLTLNSNNIDVYYSGDELIEHLDQEFVYDIIFLDIEMTPINGIDVGKHIRETLCNNVVQIIYISHSDSYAMELFEIRPLNFLIKPISKDKILKAYFSAKKLITNGNPYFLYQKDKITIKKPINDIIYFESDNKKINIITHDNKESFYGKIEDVCNQLQDCFFLHIHKSYYINYYHVTKIAYDKVLMSNGKILSISQRRRKKIREQHIIFDKVVNNNAME